MTGETSFSYREDSSDERETLRLGPKVLSSVEIEITADPEALTGPADGNEQTQAKVDEPTDLSTE